MHQSSNHALDDLVALFPAGTRLGAGGLEVGGCSLAEVARELGTPLLLVDEASLRGQARRFCDGLSARWPASRVAFASKAFPCAPVERLLAEEGLGCDVVGGGELAIAVAAGFDPDAIYLHGNAKDDADVAAALAAGVGTIVIDSFDDIDRLERLGAGAQRVLVRVTPGIKPDTHEKVSTGHDQSKFGLGPADAGRAIQRIRAGGALMLDGLHVHVGSQILTTEPFRRSVESLALFGSFRVYDLGGGLGVPYRAGEAAPTVEAYLDAVVTAARDHLPAQATLVLEPGRSLVARCGVTLYSVVTVKRGRAATFVAVDGGMGDNLEPMLYGTRFDATIASRPGRGASVELVGRHCESGDLLVSGASLREPQVGDVVAVPGTGAYCYSLMNNYNGALRPPVVLVRDGEPQVAVRRETYDDLMRRDRAMAPAAPLGRERR